jgi:peptidyl-prolyl cis-trans isomerase SurA
MSKITSGFFAFCLGLVAAGSAMAQTRELSSSGELLDGIAALVDSGVVLKSEVRNRLQTVADNFLQQQMQQPPDQRSQLPPRSQLEQQVLERLILEEIEVQHADSVGIEIGDDDLNQVLAQIANNVGTNLATLPTWFESQGIDYANFREDQRRELMIQALERNEVVSKITIDKREFEQCMASATASQSDEYEYNISHILIGFPLDATPEQIDKAEARVLDIERQLDEGADFAQLAAAYSDGQAALDGGSLGWRKGAALPTIFADEVQAMKVGEHSAPIRSNGGFHIVRLNDMRGAEPDLVDQVRARHILLTPTEVLDDDATYQKLLGIREQILNGDDFATVAEAVSEDAVSAAKGGDLGWGELSDYAPEFSAKLESLEIGELSEPFRTPYGWHIAEVTDRRSYDQTDDVMEQNCRQQLGSAKVDEELNNYHRRLRDEAYVVKRL